jgi:hypothetical protein
MRTLSGKALLRARKLSKPTRTVGSAEGRGLSPEAKQMLRELAPDRHE